MPGLTLQERYYGINKSVRKFLRDNGFDVPIYKYGIDPATAKDDLKSQAKKYPYFQSFLIDPKPQSWTSFEKGRYTRFEYQLSFFTSPQTEFTNDGDLWKPFEAAQIAFSDAQSDVLRIDPNDPDSSTYADVLDIRTKQDFGLVSGAVVPSGVIIVKLAAMIGYPMTIAPVGSASNIDAAISITNS
jgi:hypothetical protein